jgi:hypothetical protein
VTSVVFSPDGTCAATASWDNTARLWGLSNAEIHKNRLTGRATRSRLAPTVDAWFAGDLASVKAKLAEAKATMPPADWREAANLVLIKAEEQRDAAKAAAAAADDK